MDVFRFDTLVPGSAVHAMDLLLAAVDSVRAHRDELTGRDVRLFGIGLGPALGGWTEAIAQSHRLPTAHSTSTHP
ncbi:hypothetical protein [Nocardia pneumoniae]|uniref:hypothetical protein n=1 Tax=Nocardia pneumoniae TaxID=228601 RepID=UPI0003113CFF|nr:hypothetical protein [Nocardia pneumoniae]